ncbi:10758_t:CDS:2 [Gigaspora margarita]|uniref:10758_t:CDS:1 n=1 Tax=Gigaspora margarita TaxID=4874 RepID=A0ABM8W6Y9_GIGMA|nr:10758_t:CDS:2 [Gigaspora margarita]
MQHDVDEALGDFETIAISENVKDDGAIPTPIKHNTTEHKVFKNDFTVRQYLSGDEKAKVELAGKNDYSGNPFL